LGGELDFESASDLGNAPNRLRATVVKLKTGGTNIDLNWDPPNVGIVTVYSVFRATCPNGTSLSNGVTTPTCSLSPTVLPVPIAGTPCDPILEAGFNFCDGTAKSNSVYLYLVTATLDNKKSGPSNIVPAALK
jgi:hypothetical protein